MIRPHCILKSWYDPTTTVSKIWTEALVAFSYQLGPGGKYLPVLKNSLKTFFFYKVCSRGWLNLALNRSCRCAALGLDSRGPSHNAPSSTLVLPLFLCMRSYPINASYQLGFISLPWIFLLSYLCAAFVLSLSAGLSAPGAAELLVLLILKYISMWHLHCKPACLSLSPSLSLSPLSHSLPTQLVEADGHPPTKGRLCSRSLPLKRTCFPCHCRQVLTHGGIVGSLQIITQSTV